MLSCLYRFGLFFIALSTAATAQDQMGPPLSLNDVVKRVLDVNPELHGQRFALAGADARREQAALRPPVELGVDAENVFGTDRLSALDDAELTLQLSTVLELGGKRDLRVDAAQRERDLMLTGFNARRLDLIAEATRRFIWLVAAERTRALLQQSQALAAATREAVRQRVVAGRATALEQQNAEIVLTRVGIEVRGAETEIAQSWHALSAMWGGAGPMSPTSAELFVLPELAPVTALEALMQDNPSLGRFATERRVEEAKVRLAEAQSHPDVTVAAGIRRLQADRSNALVLSASVPLGAGSRAVAYAAEARSRLAEVDSREQALRSELKAVLVGAHLEASRRTSELSTLRDAAVPGAEAAVTLAQDGFSAGRYSLLELLSAQQQLIDLQRQSIAAAVGYHMAVIEIERLTAQSATQTPAP